MALDQTNIVWVMFMASIVVISIWHAHTDFKFYKAKEKIRALERFIMASQDAHATLHVRLVQAERLADQAIKVTEAMRRPDGSLVGGPVIGLDLMARGYRAILETGQVDEDIEAMLDAISVPRTCDHHIAWNTSDNQESPGQASLG